MNTVERQYELLAILRRRRRRGATPREMMEATGASKQTLYRDLKLLSRYVPVTSETVNGEARWKLLSDGGAPLGHAEREALGLALAALAPLEGTSVHRTLRALLRGAREPGATRSHVAVKSSPLRADQSVNARLDDAIQRRRRARVLYRGAHDEDPRPRVVEPVELETVNGVAYVVVYDLEAGGWRTFKLVRIAGVEVLTERSMHVDDYDPVALREGSVGVWVGEPVDVEVLVRAEVARFASEWPLSPDQTLQRLEDGAVVVRARVAGTVEAKRWVLRWGRGALVLAPASFRAEVAEELGAALAGYGGGSGSGSR